MSVKTRLVVAPLTPTTPLVAGQPLSFEWLKFFQGLAQAVNTALTILGQFDGQIGPDATVAGHPSTLALAIQNLSATGTLSAAALTGVVPPAQLPAALPSVQGAVTLPVGAPSSTLGSAAFDNSTDFDPAGAAAAAQAAAIAASDPVGSANTALTNAKAYTDAQFAGAVSHTVTLAAITVGGTNGSLTFDANGLLTSFVDPT